MPDAPQPDVAKGVRAPYFSARLIWANVNLIRALWYAAMLNPTIEGGADAIRKIPV